MQFKTRFDAELRDAGGALQAAPDGADAQAALAECAKQVEALHGSISAAVHFLPLATREACSKATQELEARLRAERERLAPKKKFGFKNRAKLAAAPMAPTPPADAVGAVAGAVAGEGAADAAAAAAAERLASTTAKHHEDSFVAVADCAGFRGQRGARLVREAAEAAESGGGSSGGGAGGGVGGDFALEGLEECEVRLLRPSNSLWIRRLTRCTIVAVPLPGSIYVTECTDCTFVMGARQVRLHTSTGCDFYLHVSSHPIVERCDGLRFAPYPALPAPLTGVVAAAGLDPSRNEWRQVDDFDWLKAQQSPHWSFLPEQYRRAAFDFSATAGEPPAADLPPSCPPSPAAEGVAEGGTITVTVLFFAAAREEAETSRASLQLDAGSDTEALRALLAQRYPDLQPLLPRCALARNAEYVQSSEELRDGDEVAVIPPVSGG